MVEVPRQNAHLQQDTLLEEANEAESDQLRDESRLTGDQQSNQSAESNPDSTDIDENTKTSEDDDSETLRPT